MAENIPNIPTGAVPPKKETGKVQPKKETVRINLPPKPTAAPTIKLPTLPPGGPIGSASSAPSISGAPAASAAPVAAPAASPLRAAGAPAAQQPRPAAAPAGRPAAAPARAATISPIDNILAIAAIVVVLLAVGTTVWLGWLL